MSEPTKRKRSPGRRPRSAEPTAQVHLLLSQSLLDRLDAQLGDVPRIVVIRNLVEAWVIAQEAAHAARQ